MDPKGSIPSDVIGTLPPLCPSDIAPDAYANRTDSLMDSPNLYRDIGASNQDWQNSQTRRKKNGSVVDDTDVTASSLMDTIHYMSPVSPLSARSVYEGDIDYMKLLHEPFYPQVLSTISSSTISCVEPELQRTIAIVKPDAMQYQDVIVRAITQAGFSTIDKRVIHFTPEQVSEFYCQYYGSPAFPHQVVSMSIGPVLVLSIADNGAVARWKDLVGPDKMIREEWFFPMSMRVRFGIQDSVPNAVHASENLTDSYKENRYVFPRNTLEPIIQPLDKVNDYCGLYINPTLLDALSALVKVKPIDPILYLADWLLLHNPYQPQFSKEIGLVPT